MPISADRERDLLNAYKIPTLYPDVWPRQDNESSDDEEDEVQLRQRGTNGFHRHGSKNSLTSRSSLSKYRNIDRHASIRSGTTDSESLVQKDEPDPLGMAPSVASELKKRGLGVEDDLKLRNRFMLSSTSFSPALFLSQVHKEATTQDLLRGLDHLSHSIEQKSASLKVLVESNFEKFVRAKATIDNVYIEMRTQGEEAEMVQASGRRSHSRQISRGQGHFRNSSNPLSPSNKPLLNDKKKNALTKESEYGVAGIKGPLLEVAIKAEEVWGPALGGRNKEENAKAVLAILDQHKEIFRLGGSMQEAIRKNDYDSVVDLYKLAKKHTGEARNIAETAKANDVSQLGDADAQQILVTAKMWHDVSKQLERFKQDIWRRLRSSNGRKPVAVTDETDREEHMELIAVLLQLGVDDNPIWVWLNSRYLYLRSRIARSFERSRIELEIQRRKLAANTSTDAKALASFLQSAVNKGTFQTNKEISRSIDTPAIVAFWEKLSAVLSSLLSLKSGLLAEIIEHWNTTQSFINNNAQKAFPTAVFAAGLEHLELEPDDVQNLRSSATELIQLVRDSVHEFFMEPPVEDLSELYSPIPPPSSTSDAGKTLDPNSNRAFRFDPSTAPPPSPKRGDAWEKFAFWPPQANSLSGSAYLGQILGLTGTAASEVASLSVIKHTRTAEGMKTLLSAVRERCLQAVCAAWNTDAERCKYLETWVRNVERRDLTQMPFTFCAFEENVLQNMQRIAFISDAIEARGSEGVIIQPPAKLLQVVRGSYVSSLYKALSGMVENAEKARKESGVEVDVHAITVAKGSIGLGNEDRVDGSNRNIRMLMTLSNLSHLRSDAIPHLISTFESSFSVKLTEESKTIRDVLGQIDARLFQSYVRPTIESITKIVSNGISSPQWQPSITRPVDAKPYVYDVLLKLVLVHSEVSTTAPPLAPQLLSYLLEQTSLALLEAFKSRSHYPLPALMQATLDVEFLAQTLNTFTTDKAGETQSQIYLALDERTDNDARAGLQGELPEMKGVLKRLREGTKGEFGCFRRDRRGRGEARPAA